MAIFVLIVTLFGSVCFARWSYLVSCSRSLNIVDVGTIITKKGLRCYGRASATPECDAAVTVYLQYEDEDGDWINYTAWTDDDENSYLASVCEDIVVEAGRYQLYVVYKAYEVGDHSVLLEKHTGYSNIIDFPGN